LREMWKDAARGQSQVMWCFDCIAAGESKTSETGLEGGSGGLEDGEHVDMVGGSGHCGMANTASCWGEVEW
jgi:hypothetical protein